ncbi:MAG: hypothetical protein NT062_14330 [Proteobacteria bacterium]|nr:hypothetical protein [Pseudomonadota bacterium]
MRFISPILLIALVTLGGCPKKLPGGPSIPGGDKVPGGVPGGLPGNSDTVEPNGCGSYASMGDVGRKLHAFLEATATMQKVTGDTVAVVKESCVIMGKELGMSEADLGGQTKEVCAKVYGTIDSNMKVAVKAKAAFKVVIVPAVCKVSIDASAKAAAECEGSASANVSASCSGKCSGKCDGKCEGKVGTGGNAGQCDGVCKGKCEGSCEGHADVNASAQCKASAEVKANAEVTCTDPSVTVTLDAKMTVDKTKAEQTLKALKAGLPKIFSVKARLEPLQAATTSWVKSAGELASSGAGFAQAFKDQALCITGQLAAVAKASTQIQANVSVSVEVSASASASAGG